MTPANRPMFPSLWFLPALLIAGLFSGPVWAANAAPAGAAVERIAVLTSANHGGDGRAVLRYAESDAYAVGKVLRQAGGLGSSNELHVFRATPDKLTSALERAASRAKTARARSRRVEFIFYYSGHSDETGLLLGEDKVTYVELRKLLDAVPADVHIAILDSCASGAFTRIKGGRRRAPFLVNSTSEVEGHAFLTSSSAEETAQESDRIGGSFFTHFLVSGMRGAADSNGDRQVTLGEAYEFAYEETLEHTQATSAGVQHAAYDIRLSGTGELVMTDLRQANARLELEPSIRGRVWVRTEKGRLAAELVVPGDGDPVLLALEPGDYTVTVENEGLFARAPVTLTRKGQVSLAASAFSTIPKEETTARGAPADSDYLQIPFNIGVLPALSVGRRGRPTIVNFGAALLWAESARVHGLSMALAADVAAEHVIGLQWSVGANVSTGRLAGAQLTVGGNWVSEDARGAQLSAGFNAAGRLQGAQLTSGINWAGEGRGVQLGNVNVAGRSFSGAQLALLNVGRNVEGAQLGLVNVGRDVSVQVGLVNIAKEADASIGLFAFTQEGGVHPEVYTSDTAMLNLGLRFPAKYTYSFLAAGFHPIGESAGWQFGAGFGGHIPVGNSAAIDIDLGGYSTFTDRSFQGHIGGLTKARLMFAWSFAPRLTVWGGPTFNVVIEEDDDRPRLGYGWTAWSKNNTSGGRVALWPGFVGGLRF
ncbi:MAG: caspase family protein [Nannocystales bacterium]